VLLNKQADRTLLLSTFDINSQANKPLKQ